MQSNLVLGSFGYTVVSNIGRGTYSTVQLALSTRHCKTVAIKMMQRRGFRPIFLKHLIRELTIIRRVRHPHIIQVLEVFEMPNGMVYIVMEAAAMNLQQKIRELNTVPSQQARAWFSQLLSAVEYLHQQDIVHRDLKCENVLLAHNGQVKLTDFGFSRFSKGFPEVSRTFCCTPLFAAPEVLMRVPYDPKKNDVWGLGIILYTMITGQFPYMDVNRAKLTLLQQQPLSYPSSLNVETACRDLISYMLCFDAFDRPSVSEVAQHPWLQMREEPVLDRLDGRAIADQEDSGSSTSPGGDVRLLQPSPKVDRTSSSSTSEDEMFFSAEESVEDEWHSLSGSSTDRDALSPQDVGREPEQKESSSRAASVTCRNVEEEEEEEEEEEQYGCCPLYAGFKRAANTFVVAPIVRASQRMRRFFTDRSGVHNSSAVQQVAHHSAASTEAPDVPLQAETQHSAKQGKKKLRFPKFKQILKKKAKGDSPPTDIQHG